MAPTQYTKITLAERPREGVTDTTFKREVVPFDLTPGQGQILVKALYASIDPAMRGWLNDTRSYLPPVKIGEVMRALVLGEVVETGPGSKFTKGDIVSGVFGWTEYGVHNDSAAEKIQTQPGTEYLDYLGPLGMTGLTAYFGLLDVGKIKAGETLVVSGAAGATGSVVCQIGKKLGAKVYAIAGSQDKCDWLEKDLGVEKAFNYKSPTFHADFRQAVGYLDVYFDNVGGDMLNFMLTRLKMKARIVLCGAISDYNTSKPKGLSSYTNLISQRAKIEGFVVFDYAKRYPEALRDLSAWAKDGSLKRRFHVVKGLENAPEALKILFSGGNTGKLVLQIADTKSSL
ncbi:alcohol dehydrogenase [Trametes versicolor FP-101664 SS1]|uniref:alcohol dehydrogenase n=1 Tax=Trametes versicolor (strain FP-101664) TaxID=717944 RepID=UPI0004622FCB|nr:alcohol dehydrogenase [Trametes versicolor FP-101664 SS1]EIW57598.1 alcohol dehydrogenase [Trametes versicolor FP-101664 SS1]